MYFDIRWVLNGIVIIALLFTLLRIVYPKAICIIMGTHENIIRVYCRTCKETFYVCGRCGETITEKQYLIELKRGSKH